MMMQATPYAPVSAYGGGQNLPAAAVAGLRATQPVNGFTPVQFGSKTSNPFVPSPYALKTRGLTLNNGLAMGVGMATMAALGMLKGVAALSIVGIPLAIATLALDWVAFDLIFRGLWNSLESTIPPTKNKDEALEALKHNNLLYPKLLKEKNIIETLSTEVGGADSLGEMQGVARAVLHHKAGYIDDLIDLTEKYIDPKNPGYLKISQNKMLKLLGLPKPEPEPEDKLDLWGVVSWPGKRVAHLFGVMPSASRSDLTSVREMDRYFQDLYCTIDTGHIGSSAQVLNAWESIWTLAREKRLDPPIQRFCAQQVQALKLFPEDWDVGP